MATPTRQVERVRETMIGNVERFAQEREAFLAEFAVNPNYAFAWKAARVMLAQERAVLAAEWLDVDVNEPLGIDNKPVEANLLAPNLDALRKHLTRMIELLARFESASTSAMSNLVEQAKLRAAVELLALIEDAT